MKSFTLIAAAFALCLAAQTVRAADEPAAAPAAAEKAAPAAEAEKAPVVAATPKKPEMSTFFMNVKDGDWVKSPLKLKFGVKGFRVAPAGTMTPGTGHLHLFIDSEITDQKAVIPNDPRHMHFGKGQKEATVTLAPGKHTLQIVVGDGNHMPLDPPVQSDKITVNVQ